VFPLWLQDEPGEARFAAIRFCEASDTRWSDGLRGPTIPPGPALSGLQRRSHPWGQSQETALETRLPYLWSNSICAGCHAHGPLWPSDRICCTGTTLCTVDTETSVWIAISEAGRGSTKAFRIINHLRCSLPAVCLSRIDTANLERCGATDVTPPIILLPKNYLGELISNSTLNRELV